MRPAERSSATARLSIQASCLHCFYIIPIFVEGEWAVLLITKRPETMFLPVPRPVVTTNTCTAKPVRPLPESE